MKARSRRKNIPRDETFIRISCCIILFELYGSPRASRCVSIVSRASIKNVIALTWGALWQNSSSVREASVAPSTLKLSSGTDGNCNCRLAHCTQAATSAALQRRGSAIKKRRINVYSSMVHLRRSVGRPWRSSKKFLPHYRDDATQHREIIGNPVESIVKINLIS